MDIGFQAKAGDRVVVVRNISINELLGRLRGPLVLADSELSTDVVIEITYRDNNECDDCHAVKYEIAR